MADITLLILLLVAAVPCYSYHCDSDLSHCHTSLNIDYSFLRSYNDCPTDPSNQIEKSQRPFRLIQLVLANDTMPGPTIIVYKDQKISIVVNNNLINNAITIHWHGIDQLGWPFMDGVGFVTQCPIEPGQSFNYTFQPRFGGTYWYHSHVGNQRDMGFYGALIVLRNEEEPVGNILQMQEWNPLFDSVALLKGNLSSMSKPKAILINGKGETGSLESSTEIITLEKSTHQHRFRLIAAGSIYPLLFSISGLKMSVIETDGYPVEPIKVDKIIIYPAERYDFVLDLENTSVGNYGINVNLLEGKTLTISATVVGQGNLQVSGTDTGNSHAGGTGDVTKPTVLNCPFSIYPNQPSLECIPITELISTNVIPDSEFNFELKGDAANIKRTTQPFFLNFGFPKGGPASVNGRQFIWPTVSSISQPSEIDNLCSNADCGPEKLCSCTNSLTLKKGEEITMVLLNMGSGMVISHPIHMHGHTFEVLKMGLPNVNSDGTIEANDDISCSTSLPKHDSVCNDAFWTDPTWEDEIPGLNTSDPVRKDTIVVPYGGYVVIRINCTNPGIWFLHCHIDPHMLGGMALMLNESFEDFGVLDYSVPKDFPSCRSFKNEPRTSDVMISSWPIAIVASLCGGLLLVLVIVLTACTRIVKVKYSRVKRHESDRPQ